MTLKKYLFLAILKLTFLNANSSFKLSCFDLYQLVQLIRDPTHRPHTTYSAIDLFVTSGPELITESGVLPVVISDHYLIYVVHEWDKPKLQGDCINFRSFASIFSLGLVVSKVS